VWGKDIGGVPGGEEGVQPGVRQHGLAVRQVGSLLHHPVTLQQQRVIKPALVLYIQKSEKIQKTSTVYSKCLLCLVVLRVLCCSKLVFSVRAILSWCPKT